MAQKAPKMCYYELLGLDRKCEVAEIKASYRKLALKMHPDKAQVHGLSVEEATRKFQQIQEAYSVLSDPQERAWYDAHREQILRGDDEPGEDPFKTKVNLYKYFSTGCYNGFGDDAGGFFAAYSELFSAVDTEEAEWEDADEEHTPMPPFGNSRSEWADVSSFYRNWLEFCSRKAFGHADKWNPKEAQNRQVRRAMEQENKKARQAAKREFNAEVRQLVQFVQKRDPRVAARQKEQMKATAEKTQRAQLDKERLKAAEARQKQERKEAMRRADEERWAEAAAARARGELLSDDETVVENEEVLEYRCEPCRKSFKSEKAFEQHARSKKHLQIVEQLRKELELELELEKEAQAQAAAEEQEESDEATTSEGSHEGVRCPLARAEEAAEEAEEEEEEDDDEDNFVARFAAVKRPEKQAAGKEAEKEDSGSSEDEDEEENMNLKSGGKTAQKRAKQKAILMERKAEKEQAEARRQAEAEEEAAAAAAQPAEPTEAASTAPSRPAIETTCAVCGEKFPSRSKLFQHIKATGHAALKPMPAAEATARGRRKKR